MIIRVWSETRDHRRRRRVVILAERENGQEYVAEPLVFRELPPHEFIEDDKATIPAYSPNVDGTAFLQAALDHAWAVGLRPAGFLDTTNQVAAMKAHLHDLRAMIFRGEVKPHE